MKTFISLSCENCPDVVQNLNLMSIYHPDLEHEMIDGALWESEVTRLGIQGVPAVFNGDTLIHSGKSSFLELLNLTRENFWEARGQQKSKDLGKFDVVVVGGGPAGASPRFTVFEKVLKQP